MLVDLIIPRDERSGSATDAGVPPFMDFMMIDQPRRQVAMRGGLALIDRLTLQRADRRFSDATDAQRRRVLDEIAYTSNPDPGTRARGRVLQQLQRSDGERILVEPRWASRIFNIGQHVRLGLEWLPDEALRKLGEMQ